jgi:hypothetical protein
MNNPQDERETYELLEQEYEVTRLLVAAGEADQDALERAAGKTLEAAQVLAIKRGWVLPDVRLWQR